MKNKKVYIIYKYNENINDLEYVKEYDSIQDIKEDYNLQNKKSVYNYIIKDIENESSYYNLLDSKYLIIKEEL